MLLAFGGVYKNPDAVYIQSTIRQNRTIPAMIARLKATLLGKWLYRLSRLPVIGLPLRWLSRREAFKAIDLAHFRAENRRHNATQARTLAAFRADHGQNRP